MMEKYPGHPGVFRRGNRVTRLVTYKDPATGATRRKWVSAPGIRALPKAVAKLQREIDLGVSPEAGRSALRDFAFQRWLPEVGNDRTRKRYASLFEHHVIPHIGGLPLRDVKRAQVRTVLRGIESTSTRTMAKAALSACLGFAVREDEIVANPCRDLGLPAPDRKEARHLDLPDVHRMIELATDVGEPMEGFITLALQGGLRISEAVVIRWSDVDLESGKVRVSTSYHGRTKSGKARSFRLPASAVASLKRVKAAQRQRLFAAHGIHQGPGTCVVAGTLGQPLHPSWVRDAFTDFAKAHEFDASPHTLRHSCAILMLSNGIDPQTAAGRLGHDVATFFRTYSHFVQSADDRAAEIIDAALS